MILSRLFSALSVRRLVFSLMALSLVSCGRSGTALSGAQGGAAPLPPKPAGPMWSEPQFSAMLQAYRQKLSGPRKALEFVITEDRARLQVQDPAKPENIDEYDYSQGRLTGPTPVQLMGANHLAEDVFPWNEVALERIPELAKTALDKGPVENGQIVQVRVGRGVVDPKVHISVALKGPRGFGGLVADTKGKILSMEKS